VTHTAGLDFDQNFAVARPIQVERHHFQGLTSSERNGSSSFHRRKKLEVGAGLSPTCCSYATLEALFVPERFDRIQLGGTLCGEITEDDADSGGESEGQQHD